MDEQKFDLMSGDALPDADKVYRIVVQTIRKGSENFMPSVSSFSLSEADKADGYMLSTDWEKKTTPEEAIARVGCSYKSNGEFKPFQNREVYALAVSFLNSIDAITAVIYTLYLTIRQFLADQIIRHIPPFVLNRKLLTSMPLIYLQN